MANKWIVKQDSTIVHEEENNELTYNFPKNTSSSNITYTINVTKDDGCTATTTITVPSGSECQENGEKLYLRLIDVNGNLYGGTNLTYMSMNYFASYAGKFYSLTVNNSTNSSLSMFDEYEAFNNTKQEVPLNSLSFIVLTEDTNATHIDQLIDEGKEFYLSNNGFDENEFSVDADWSQGGVTKYDTYFNGDILSLDLFITLKNYEYLFLSSACLYNNDNYHYDFWNLIDNNLDENKYTTFEGQYQSGLYYIDKYDNIKNIDKCYALAHNYTVNLGVRYKSAYLSINLLFPHFMLYKHFSLVFRPEDGNNLAYTGYHDYYLLIGSVESIKRFAKNYRHIQDINYRKSMGKLHIMDDASYPEATNLVTFAISLDYTRDGVIDTEMFEPHSSFEYRDHSNLHNADERIAICVRYGDVLTYTFDDDNLPTDYCFINPWFFEEDVWFNRCTHYASFPFPK